MSETSETSWNLRLRSDIRWKLSDEATGKVWIATDPLSRTHFQCSEQDYQILQWLESSSSIDSLVNRFHETFRPRRLTTAALVSFLSQCISAGVVRGTIPSRTDLTRTRVQSPSDTAPVFGLVRSCAQFVLKLFQLRFSLGNPDRFIQFAAQPFLFLFGWPGFAMCTIVMIASGYLVLMRFTEFVSCLPTWTIIRSPSALIGFGLVFVVTRVIHEFGHAIACKRFGVPCKDIGLLLSFGMICPYVDITDAWSVGSRRKRIVIALGGIYLEAIVAAVAGIAWCFTVESWMHDLFFRIMLVSSATTLLFNANPFLKYDGYFVLSDCIGMQNIRERAWQAFDALCEGRVIKSLFESVGLSIYFLLALANRISMSIGLAVFLYALACQWHLAGVGVALFLIYACSAITLALGSWVSRESETQSRRSAWLGWFAVACLIAWAVTMPLPNRFGSTGELIMGERRPVYAKEQGIVSQCIQSSASEVPTGDVVIVEMENLQIEEELVAIKSQLHQAEQDIVANDRAAFADIDKLATRPERETTLKKLKLQEEEVLARQQSLKITASKAGYFVLAERNSMQSSDLFPPSWDLPTIQRLRKVIAVGELLQQHELIGYMYEGDQRRIDCPISDEDVNLIRIGTKVRVRLKQQPTRVMDGIVEEISSAHQTLQRETVTTNASDKSRLMVSIQVPALGNDLVHGGSAEVVFVCEERSILDRVVDAGLRNLRWR
jgi:putative peptide zinc metalloprotease protein